MSAIDHSKIESANDPETRAIDYEASRIARQAADALRQSRRVCFFVVHCFKSGWEHSLYVGRSVGESAGLLFSYCQDCIQPVACSVLQRCQQSAVSKFTCTALVLSCRRVSSQQ